MRRITGPKVLLVTPGVRSAGAAKGDQKRVATPAEAIASGADYLVIGRQVTRADDPRAPAEDSGRDLYRCLSAANIACPFGVPKPVQASQPVWAR